MKNKVCVIGRWDDEIDDFTILETFDSFDDADARYDYWVGKYPNDWVDVIPLS